VVARLRAAIPGITFSTDLIVGFPGETEAEFQDTLSLVGEAGFDEAYTFKYSPRDGTPAVRMPGHIDDAVASERLDRLIAVVRDQSRRRNIGRVGEVHEVLVERPAKRGDLLLGRTRHNSMVLLDLPVTALGSYRTVRLSGTTGSTFTGELLSEAPALAVL
jgi:tRNA-2-methylthio-N6-dimethylallyladenosine synthase